MFKGLRQVTEYLQHKACHYFSKGLFAFLNVSKTASVSKIAGSAKKIPFWQDDLWEAITFEEIRIPDPDQEGNDCKIEVTTRLRSVCDFIQTRQDVEVKVLIKGGRMEVVCGQVFAIEQVCILPFASSSILDKRIVAFPFPFKLCEVADKIDEAVNLLQRGQFPDGVVIDRQCGDQEILYEPLHLRGQSMAEKMDEIMEVLMDPKIRKIGCMEWGDVGKTTIMQNIFNKLKVKASTTQQPFDRIIWVTVSKEMESLVEEYFEPYMRSIDILNVFMETQKALYHSLVYNTIVEEIGSFKRLKTLVMMFTNFNSYEKAMKHIQWDKLEGFHIVLDLAIYDYIDLRPTLLHTDKTRKVVRILGIPCCNYCLPLDYYGLVELDPSSPVSCITSFHLPVQTDKLVISKWDCHPNFASLFSSWKNLRSLKAIGIHEILFSNCTWGGALVEMDDQMVDKLLFQRLPAPANIHVKRDWWEELDWDSAEQESSFQSCFKEGRKDMDHIPELRYVLKWQLTGTHWSIWMPRPKEAPFSEIARFGERSWRETGGSIY
ncbi:hypothetical protein Sjap_025549 [Stephania japonica]|uniref:NB-ARC domain-containing protein n=1 Tax=Stephania japonica TaxID=461633 RepID=A0AAP0HEA9_9MAGN